MNLLRLRDKLMGLCRQRHPCHSPPRGYGWRVRPRLEPLEDRIALATVTSAADDGGAGTLRSLINNAQPGTTIDFGPRNSSLIPTVNRWL